MSYQFHESLYRTPEVMERLRERRITLCGAGALGANLAETLARMGCQKLTVIDKDRVEERNLSTQPWFKSDVGSPKAKILANSLFRALGASLTPDCQELTKDNAGKLLKDSELVVDCFDNSPSRRLIQEHCREKGLEALHAGLAADYSEVIWDAEYTVPSEAQDDICDYPLARNLVLLTVAIASEVIVGWVATGEKRSFSLTLGDLRVTPYA
jgi:molybdopterin/thiamine biosynthesis adenylyltransferase